MKHLIRNTLVAAALFAATPAVAQDSGATNAPPVPVGQAAPSTGTTDTADAKPALDKVVPRPKTTEELRQRITFLLSGYEFFPTRDDLDKAGDPSAVAAVLQDIVRDQDATAMHRLRAVDALGFYDLPQVAGFLRKLTRGAKAAEVSASARHSSLMQHHAITALARSQRDESVTDLEPFLAGSDLQLKLTAIVALGKHGKDNGRQRLRTLIESDEHRLVQREARKYLK